MRWYSACGAHHAFEPPERPNCDEKNDRRDSQIIPNQRIWMLDDGGEPSMSLKTMTVSKLKDLKRQVEAAIHAKVTERRQEIESELLKLSRLHGGRGAKAG